LSSSSSSSSPALQTKKLVTVTNLGTLKRKKTWYELGNGKLNLTKMKWTTKTKQRMRGKTAATSDTYYIPPNNCKQFRSFAEIKRFLKTPFHERDQLIPVGFTSSVEEMSFKHKGKTTVYTQTVVGDSYRCLFKITAADAQKESICEPSPDQAWRVLSERIRNTQEGESAAEAKRPPINGYKRFGLSIRKVTLLLEGLKGSDGDDLKKYKFAVTRKRKTGKGIKKNAKKRKMAKSESAAKSAPKSAPKSSASSTKSSAPGAAESSSPCAKRAKTANTGVQQTSGELASPEPEQPLDDIMSPDDNASGSVDVPSPEAADKFSPVVVDLSEGGFATSGAAARREVGAKTKEKKKMAQAKKEKEKQPKKVGMSKKRKAAGMKDAAAAKKQATLGAFFSK